jgi:hypothetical protein
MMKNNTPQSISTISTTARRAAMGAALCATLALGACASLGNSSPEAQVSQRANERWAHLVAKRFDEAYTYTTPAFRGVVDAATYRGRIGAAVTWLGAETIRVTCTEPDNCKAVVRLDYQPLFNAAAFGKLSTHIDETWLKENDQWYIFANLKGE